jgi:hypothetical protein
MDNCQNCDSYTDIPRYVTNQKVAGSRRDEENDFYQVT